MHVRMGVWGRCVHEHMAADPCSMQHYSNSSYKTPSAPPCAHVPPASSKGVSTDCKLCPICTRSSAEQAGRVATGSAGAAGKGAGWARRACSCARTSLWKLNSAPGSPWCCSAMASWDRRGRADSTSCSKRERERNIALSICTPDRYQSTASTTVKPGLKTAPPPLVKP